MDDAWKGIVGRQLDAAIDALHAAMVACPESLWSDRERRPEFWYVVYHALFHLDLYLSGSPDGFAPPAPFTLDALDPRGALPERPYTKEELRGYLDHGRARCHASVAGLTVERAGEPCGFPWLDMSVAELFVYNLRHVQQHAAQLNLILRQTTRSPRGLDPRGVAPQPPTGGTP